MRDTTAKIIAIGQKYYRYLFIKDQYPTTRTNSASTIDSSSQTTNTKI